MRKRETAHVGESGNRPRVPAHRLQARPDQGNGQRDLASWPFGADVREDRGRRRAYGRVDQFSFRQQGSAAARDAARGVGGIRRGHGDRASTRRVATTCAHCSGSSMRASAGGSSDSRKIAVWYAFLAESNARGDYQRICGERDQAYSRTVTDLCTRLIAAHGDRAWPDAEAVALGLAGPHRPAVAGHSVRGRRLRSRRRPAPVPRLSLQRVPLARRAHRGGIRGQDEGAGAGARRLRQTRPCVTRCRPGSITARNSTNSSASTCSCRHGRSSATRASSPHTGDYVAFEFFGRRGFVVRDASGELRAFHNVCAHRAHAVVSGERGSCGKFLTCMYHGWTYHLDGRNRSVSAPDTFPEVRSLEVRPEADRARSLHGHGVRALPRGRGRRSPSAWRRTAAELAHYRMDQMVPLDDLWTPRARDRLEERGRELRRGLSLPDRSPGALGADGGAVRPRDLPRRHDAPLSPHAREAAEVMERARATRSSCR